ncbi:MAG: thermonuclease family protein [Patescibacteria group bacterium]
MTTKDWKKLGSVVLALLIIVLGSVIGETVGSVEDTDADIALDTNVAIDVTQPVDGSVDRVIDGDTVDVVLAGEVTRIRLIGVDTPETVDPRKEVQCFGLEASAFVQNLLADQVVTVEFDESQGMTDKYGRALAYLRLADGTNVGEKLLRDGYGYEYTYSKAYKYQQDFKNAEQLARDTESGLWSSETCGGNR